MSLKSRTGVIVALLLACSIASSTSVADQPRLRLRLTQRARRPSTGWEGACMSGSISTQGGPSRYP